MRVARGLHGPVPCSDPKGTVAGACGRALRRVTSERWRPATVWRSCAAKERRSVDAGRAERVAGPLHAYDVRLSRDSIAVDPRGRGRVAQALRGHRGGADYDDLNDP
ncbi:hypothetical protein BE04_49820 [Sorangium cellulosum]|uniref:Uncharacterized protein n=2 Tax=Sorangium cellulosum TaxID=56 RepID=A0A150PWX9_SORCE|nr:hypothetical protein [Sorangium cellulosum]AGP38423.1 hypothetical protein SCE1572_30455 [Sorangium cellulosum So0157-2]KYF60214.1 hypothetical protein BE04_49820 [Sorangium cellulosum]